MILGQDVDKYKDDTSAPMWDQFGFEKMQSFSGALSQLNFWSGKISNTRIELLAECRGGASHEGDTRLD